MKIKKTSKIKKKILAIIAFCITSITVNAQTINGIIVDETDVPIESVNVVLNTADSVFIEGTTTNKSGEFALRKGSETLKRLTFSYTGYQTKTINVTQGNVGKIIILSDTFALKEAVVIGSNTTFKDGKRIIRPTTEQIEKSPTGFILLDNLELPRLNIDIVKNSISVLGGGSAVLLINGREVDNNEIIGLDSKTIINIEYSDIPSARFAGASIIVNFVVKQVEKGGMLVTDFTNGLTMIYGEDIFSAKFYNGNSQFSVSYMPQFRDLKSQWRDNEETFHLNGTTIERKELGEPARFRYLFHNFRFKYNYFKDNRMFDVALSSEIESFPNNDFKSKLFTNTGSDTLFMTDNSQNTAFTPRLRVYYQEPLSENQMLYVSVSGNYNKRNYKRDYQELLNDNTVENYFYSNVDEKQQIYNASVSYENLINLGKSGWKMNFDAALKHNYSSTKNFYDNKIQKTTTNIYINRSEAGGNVRFTKGKSWIHGGISLHRNSQTIGEINITNYNLFGGFSGKYAMGKRSNITCDVMIAYNEFPPLSYLSNIDQFIDSIQIRRGNAYLKNSKFYQGCFYYDYETPNIYILTKMLYSYTLRPLMESSFLGDNHIIRTVENHKNFQMIQPSAVITIKNVWSLFNIRFFGGFDRYISNGNTYTHRSSIFWFGGKINFKYKKFQLTYEMNNKASDTFWGETLYRSENSSKITLYYINSKFYFGIGCFNILSNYAKGIEINNSTVAPYRRYEYINDFKRGKGIFIKFVKTFRWGQQKDEANVKASDEKTESAILKGQK
ncbi:MAG: carboxypeptidase-like regulatory domain-containing protein [Prevotellaceae bacterium]|nr:carboxypeptidase-like regulatory domain-containing protein [Prevotellaceae bacterium]